MATQRRGAEIVEVTFVPAHFNTNAYAFIPEYYRVEYPNGCWDAADSPEDARQLAESQGYQVRYVN